MKNKTLRNSNNWYVVHKRDGIVIEFKRNAKKEPQPFLSYNTAKRAWEQMRSSYQLGGEWLMMTTYQLASTHKREWEKARV
jgi:hypothetical protein